MQTVVWAAIGDYLSNAGICVVVHTLFRSSSPRFNTARHAIAGSQWHVNGEKGGVQLTPPPKRPLMQKQTLFSDSPCTQTPPHCAVTDTIFSLSPPIRRMP